MRLCNFDSKVSNSVLDNALWLIDYLANILIHQNYLKPEDTSLNSATSLAKGIFIKYAIQL